MQTGGQMHSDTSLYNVSEDSQAKKSQRLFFNLAIPGLFFLYFIFSMQLTVVQINCTDEWLQTVDLWRQKQPL